MLAISKLPLRLIYQAKCPKGASKCQLLARKAWHSWLLKYKSTVYSSTSDKVTFSWDVQSLVHKCSSNWDASTGNRDKAIEMFSKLNQSMICRNWQSMQHPQHCYLPHSFLLLTGSLIFFLSYTVSSTYKKLCPTYEHQMKCWPVSPKSSALVRTIASS